MLSAMVMLTPAIWIEILNVYVKCDWDYTGLPHEKRRHFIITPKENTVAEDGVFQQGRQDSNPRPAVLETDALPAELRPYVEISPAKLLLGSYLVSLYIT
jgi:hypothetical protein